MATDPELTLLSSINDRLEPSLWNLIIQTLAFIFAIVSVAFSVQSYVVAMSANRFASEANQVALLTLCLSSNNTLIEQACGSVFQIAALSLPDLTTSIFGIVPATGNGTTGNGTSTPHAASGLSKGGIAGIITGGILATMIFLVAGFLFILFARRRKAIYDDNISIFNQPQPIIRYQENSQEPLRTSDGAELQSYPRSHFRRQDQI
ncbi:uncharacterized protein PAC_08621 [Phialocephala subalpina]|uniref:Uncharacterized protein n=1 Tax=Phialocephala subalpina TaxID=576137 RepID=A0A1L7X130_9HELO|nr:uncharacterized protein PAC_08621 [Phialocephala subalpina]